MIKFLSLLTFFSLHFTSVFCQSVTVEEVDRKLETLSDKEKVTYINDNFYKLYSADLSHAAELSKRAAALAHKNNWKDQEAYALVHQGVAQFLQGNYEQALPFYNRAIDLFDSLKHYDGLALAHNETAVFFGRNRDYKRSYEHLDKSLQYSIQANNLEQKGTSLGHRATLMEREGKVEEAFKIYQEIYTIRLEQKDSVGLGYILLDLAMGEQRKKNLKGALDYIQQSTTIRGKIGDQQGLAINHVTIGDTYVAFNDFQKAIPYYKQGLSEALNLNYADLARYAYDQLASAYVGINDYRAAFNAQHQSRTYNDSLFNIERSKAIADMQSKYETEKKEQEIILQRVTLAEQDAALARNYTLIIGLVITLALLVVIIFLVRNRSKRKQELLRKEHELELRDALIQASIQSQEVERKRFAQDLHDGMGQLISSLRLSVANMNTQQNADERHGSFDQSEKILHEMHREIRGIAFNLMPQTLIQYGLVPALEEMAQRVNETGKMVIRVKGFDLPDRLEEVQEISLYRVIQEWINNVIKYANATSIEVQLVGYENEINITVEDNGTGFNPSVLDTGKGHGWRNIQSRLNLIKSSIDVDSREGAKGTTMIIHLPVKSVNAVIPQSFTEESKVSQRNPS